MKIGLIDLEINHRRLRFPNLALMKLSTWHQAQGDAVTLGHPGDVTYVSCIFTKHRHVAEVLAAQYETAVIGGPGWDLSVTLPPEAEACRPDYSLYGLTYGLGRLTAGCPGGCPWCIVPAAEGGVSRSVAHAGDLANGSFLVLLDSNILACPDWTDHFAEIRERGITVCFTQGLDIRYVNDMVAEQLARLKIRDLHRKHDRLWFAWDRPEIEEHVREGIAALNKAGIKSYRLRFYVLCGHSTTWEQDWYRFAVLRDLGAEPFIMLYEGAGKKLRAFARYVNRNIYKAHEWSEYDRWCEANDGQLSLALPG